MRGGALSAAGLVVAGAVASAASAAPPHPTLIAASGPGHTIAVSRHGRPIAHLAPGTYTLRVRNAGGSYDFHLTGPGVDRATPFGRNAVWTVTFRKGVYRFVCDDAPGAMHGSLAVG